MINSILFINASSRKQGTSTSFSRSLSSLSESKGIETNEISSLDFLNNKYTLEEIEVLIKSTDIISIITPLYIDTLPYSLIYFLEKISINFSDLLKGKSIFVIAQSGFPRSMILDPILNSTELFALEHELKFLGGIRYGGGVIINGAKLESHGKEGKSIIKYFDIMLDDIFSGNSISEDVKSNLGNNVPKLLYRPLAAFMNHKTKKYAKANNIDNLLGKVYAEDNKEG